MVQMGVSRDAPGYDHTWLTTFAHCITGQRTSSPVTLCVTVSCFLLFFCILNVMEMLLAIVRRWDSACRSFPDLKKHILRRQTILCIVVCFAVPWGIHRIYRQKRRRQLLPAMWLVQFLCFGILWRINMGRAFCCLVLGLCCRKPGVCEPFDLKVSTTLETVPRTIPCPAHRATAKAPTTMIHLCWLNFSI